MTARHPPDLLTLERMVLGGEDDRDAWEDLLSTPEAHNAWGAAVLRRQRIDTFAALLATYPWLATPMLTLRRAMRRHLAGTWSGATLDLSSPLSATLSVDAPRAVTLGLAETRVLELAPGMTVGVTTLPAGTRLRRLTDVDEQPFDAPGWQMEAGDGLVVLLAVGADGAPLAALILVETPFGENPG
jgi:hypothetical protein